MTTFLAVVGAVTPPGRLNAAIATAVEMAAARPGVSASLLNLADHRVSFADGRPPERFDDDTGTVVARVGGGLLLDRAVYHRRGWLPLALIPYELLIVPVLFGAGLVRRSLVWRGRRYWIGPHGKILRSAAAS